jgi:flagellar operon protein
MSGTPALSLQAGIAAHRSAGVWQPPPAMRQANGASSAAHCETASFSSLLQQRVDAVKLSAHAATRMKSRTIELTPEMAQKLDRAVDGAARKGARNSLVLMNNCAFIVNIPNRTVITAMDGATMKENIFTNIDSAVVAD